MTTQKPICDPEVWFEIARSQLTSILPHCQFLSNGQLSVLVTAAGAGFVRWHDLTITRWRPDRIAEASGSFFYVRDLESGCHWSIGFQPSRRPPDEYMFRAAAGRSEIARCDDGLGSSLQTAVSPTADVLLRRCSLTNNSSRVRYVELTSYDELVLQDGNAFEAHPAFSKLFLETEFDPTSNSIVAQRRPRDAGEKHPTYVTFVSAEDGLAGNQTIQFETDRTRFIGRNRSLADPLAMETDQLAGSAGPVLDPIASLRTTLEVPAGEARSVTFVTCLHWERTGAVQLAEQYRDPSAIDRAFDDARHAHGDMTSTHRLSSGEFQDAQRLIAAAEYGTPLVASPRASDSSPAAFEPMDCLRDTRVPWLVACTRDDGPHDAYDRLLRAFGTLCRLGHPCRLAIVAHNVASGSHPDLDAAIQATVAAEHRGQIAVFPAEELSDGQLNWLVRFARATLDLAGDLDELDVDGCAVPDSVALPSAATGKLTADAGLDATSESNIVETNDAAESHQLNFVNGHGGFSRDGSEYVIRLNHDLPAGGPPLPWVNVIANEHGGFIVSENGAGCSWSRNSRQSRLTPWSNDPVCDPHGEAVYLCDEDSGRFWSAFPGPVRQQTSYEVRHGFGYTAFQHTWNEIRHDAIQFMLRDEPCKITRLRVSNVGRQARRLSVFSYCQWVLGDDPMNTDRYLQTRWEQDSSAIIANQVGRHDFPLNHVYLACWAPTDVEISYTADRGEFVGRLHDTNRPVAVARGIKLGSRVGDLADPCAALQATIELEPGEEQELVFALGEASDADTLARLARKYSSPGAVDQALQEVRGFWSNFVGRVKIETPAPAIDLMVNGWLPYQNLSCRMWGRSSFYQGGGAFGFRDQLQDAAALVYHDPQLTRHQILLHAEHQFVEGDVLHWWHPGAEIGLRTRFSDDLLWLPSLTLDYVNTTGDAAIWDEPRHFLRARQLAAGEQEAYLKPEIDLETASLYEHCCRAIDRSLTKGKHGLPLMGAGDWNDGMNRIGRAGRGESVWLGFFLFDILSRILPEVELRAENDRLTRYRDYRQKLRHALNENAWDGEWFIRAFDDDGAPVGSHRCDECRIDALVQAWSVLSGAADDDKARQALESVQRHLTDEHAGIIRLLTPAFDKTALDPGYIKGYLPGVRENGGQYTHGILWVIKAWAKLGHGDRAARLLEMISPVTHTRDRQAVQTYQTEPYVVAADVYGEPPHVGRGGWSWYTGSAGWMFRVALESVLGFQIERGRTLVLKPCLSSNWQECGLRYRWPGTSTEYDIRIHNPDQKQLGVRRALVDGQPAEVQDGVFRVTLLDDNQLHTVQVEM